MFSSFSRVDPWRIVSGELATRPGDRNGAFQFPSPGSKKWEILRVIVSDGSTWKTDGMPGEPWEHVSVSLVDRCPTWKEMCYVKGLFFKPEETVIQFHPPRSEYVNHHQYTLHLWRPIGVEIPRPPSIAVGPMGKDGGR